MEPEAATLLATLIFLGLAGGLSLSQATTQAIASAVQSGIRAANNDVSTGRSSHAEDGSKYESLLERFDAEHSDSISEADELIERPTPHPEADQQETVHDIVEFIVDSEGDEVPFDGEHYIWGDKKVTRSEVDRLIEEERIARERENAARIARHEAQREADWNTLRQKSRAEQQQFVQQQANEQEWLQEQVGERLRVVAKWLHERTGRADETLGQRYDDGGYAIWSDDDRAGTILPAATPTSEDQTRYQEIVEKYRSGELTREDLIAAQGLAEGVVGAAQDTAQSQHHTDDIAGLNIDAATTGAQVVAETGKIAATVATGGGTAATAAINAGFTALQNSDKELGKIVAHSASSAAFSTLGKVTGLDDVGQHFPIGQRIAVQGLLGGTQGTAEGMVGHVIDNGSLEGYTTQSAMTNFGMGAASNAVGTGLDVTNSNTTADVDIPNTPSTHRNLPNNVQNIPDVPPNRPQADLPSQRQTTGPADVPVKQVDDVDFIDSLEQGKRPRAGQTDAPSTRTEADEIGARSASREVLNDPKKASGEPTDPTDRILGDDVDEEATAAGNGSERQAWRDPDEAGIYDLDTEDTTHPWDEYAEPPKGGCEIRNTDVAIVQRRPWQVQLVNRIKRSRIRSKKQDC